MFNPSDFAVVVQCQNDEDNWIVTFKNERAFFLFVNTAIHVLGLRWLAYDVREFGGFTPLDFHSKDERIWFTDPMDRVVFEGKVRKVA